MRSICVSSNSLFVCVCVCVCVCVSDSIAAVLNDPAFEHMEPSWVRRSIRVKHAPSQRLALSRTFKAEEKWRGEREREGREGGREERGGGREREDGRVGQQEGGGGGRGGGGGGGGGEGGGDEEFTDSALFVETEFVSFVEPDDGSEKMVETEVSVIEKKL